MEFFKPGSNINFMAQRKLCLTLSLIVVGTCLASLVVRGLNLGIDFTGGTVIELGFPKPADLRQIRDVLAKAGYSEAIVQSYGTTRDVLIRLGVPRKGVSKAELSSRVVNDLDQAIGEKLDLRRVEFVGPEVGNELAEKGGLAMLIALGGILVYVWLRYEYRFAVGAIAATIHDALITVGFFSVFGLQFDLTVLAAVLAVIGYSLNDTVVVFDRVRENFRKMRKADPQTVINTSVNQTLSRTIMTSLATLLVVIALLVLGGELIHGFAVALFVGIVVGTYSSIYIASYSALALGVSRADLMPVKKEGTEVDARP